MLIFLLFQNIYLIQLKCKGQNNEDDDSEETKYSYKDSCDLINQLEEKIKDFLRKKQRYSRERQKDNN